MSRKTVRHLVFLATATASLACGASSASTTSGATVAAPATAPATARRDRSTITTEELRDSQLSTLYEVVQRIHPEWLIANPKTLPPGRRTAPTSVVIQVYMDTQRAGDTEVLKEMPVNSASFLKYYTASEAQARFGNGNLNGVIQVVTRTKR